MLELGKRTFPKNMYYQGKKLNRKVIFYVREGGKKVKNEIKKILNKETKKLNKIGKKLDKE